ncbi:MAG: galactosyldiacylglycerol synthase [Verrucomicrobiota bacterium]
MKPVLVLTAGYGEGHNTAAKNIAAAVVHQGGEAHVVDPFQITYGKLNDLMRKLYIFSINRAPRAWQMVYNMLDKNPATADQLTKFQGMARVLKGQVDQYQPGAVISTYPAYNFTLTDLYGRGQAPFHQATMVTDSISVNALWYLGYSDRYYVPNQPTADVLYAKGIEPGRVGVSGFPVQLDFALPERRLQPPNLKENVPEILYVVNSGKQRAPAVVRRLMEKSDWRVTIAVGTDEGLKAHIARIVEPYPGRATVIGWTRELPRLMMSHHLLISKAGGATVQEAIAAGCPMLINQVVPGQEEGNYELIKNSEAGTFASSPEQILERARRCFAHQGAIWQQWRKNILALGDPQSALKIAKDLLEVCN